MAFLQHLNSTVFLSKMGCVALLLLGGQSVIAKVSDSTGAVYGRGAPTPPSMIFKSMLQDLQLRVESVGNSIDPDGDPIDYSVRWCSEPSGQGACTYGDSQLMSESAGYYVSARAVTTRGYPQTTQGGSDWTELSTGRLPKVSNIQVNREDLAGPGTAVSASYIFEDLDGDTEGESRYQWYLNNVAIAGETAREYILKETDLNKELFVQVEPVAQSGLAKLGRKGISPGWKVEHQNVKVGNITFSRAVMLGELASHSTATTKCEQRGMRLPTRAELRIFYEAYPSNKIPSVIGWPTNVYAYWTSDRHPTDGLYWAFRLDNGNYNGTYAVNNEYYLCVSG